MLLPGGAGTEGARGQACILSDLSVLLVLRALAQAEGDEDLFVCFLRIIIQASSSPLKSGGGGGEEHRRPSLLLLLPAASCCRLLT